MRQPTHPEWSNSESASSLLSPAGCRHIPPTHPRCPRMHTPRAHPSTRSLQGCLPNPPDTEHALTHPSLSACVPACVRRLRPGVRSARTPRGSHTQTQSDQTNASPAARLSPAEARANLKKTTVCATFSAQRRPHLRKKNRSLDRRLARHVCLPPKPTLRGPFLKGLSDAGDVRDAGTPRCW